MTTERFCLKWNDFTSNVSNSFSKLRNETKMFDVTLMGNDQKQISAHKLVLSACSEFFKNIFLNSSSSNNLVLFLDGVDAFEINLMLDYIYQGEVQIHQENLDGFLEIANKFKLDGLLENKIEGETNVKQYEQPEPENVELNTFEHKAKPKYMQRDVKDRSLKLHDDSSNNEVDEKFQELIVFADKMFICTVCEKTMSHRGSMRRHLETHLTGLSYKCNICDKTFRLNNSLANHKSLSHRNA